MSRVSAFLLLIVLGGLLFAASESEPKFEPLPAPVSNNAVASVKSHGETLIFSFMGMGPKKTWDAITNTAYVMDPEAESRRWAQTRPVPGTAGRIAAAAVGARGLIFLFGGYVVDAQGGETTLRDVNIYAPDDDRWYRGEDIPVPVDDSVAGVYRDRYIYLISGWSKNDNVRDVQVYDVEKKKWLQATPIPGTPVFGHAGALVDDTIVYVDGAYKNPAGGTPKYVASDKCWMGKIDHHDPTRIQWTKLPNHPGKARYRIASGGSAKDQKIYFAGGTDNPYNFNGIGYNGQPSEPSPVTFAFDLRTGGWETIDENAPDPTMDHRGLVALLQGLLIAGGMEKGQQVTARVQMLPKGAKTK
jgi:N-acetylneuraminic acid mutarotase